MTLEQASRLFDYIDEQNYNFMVEKYYEDELYVPSEYEDCEELVNLHDYPELPF